MASVRKLPSGNYQGIANYKDATGSRRKRSFTDKSERRALRLAENYEEKMHGKALSTVSDALDAFISARVRLLSPSTLRSYISVASHLKTHHAAFCGLTEVSQKDAQRLVNTLIASGASPKTIKNKLGLLSAAVKFSGGTFPAVTLPRWELRSDFIPSEDDMKRIVEDVSGTDMEIPVALGMMGLRRSEIEGLDVADLDGEVLHIHSALVYGPDGQLHRKATKTVGSDRVIVIPFAIANKIKNQGYITHLSSHAISGRFSRTVKRLGINMRFHDLRHFFVSYCHNVLKLSDAQIMRLGGWSSDHIMKRHYLASMHDREAALQVANAFSKIM